MIGIHKKGDGGKEGVAEEGGEEGEEGERGVLISVGWCHIMTEASSRRSIRPRNNLQTKDNQCT